MSKKIRRGFNGPFSEKELPLPLEKEVLEPLVQRLRDGDNTVKESIIGSHMRLAMSIVAKYAHRFPYLQDDLVGAAMMGVCQAVDWAKTRMYNNNITPYIYETTERFIRNIIEQRLVIHIPYKVYTTWQEEEDTFVPLIQEVSNRKEDEANYFDDYDQLEELAAKTIQEQPCVYQELLNSLPLDTMEKDVLCKIIDGYTLEEIGANYNVTRQRICQIKNKIMDVVMRHLKVTEAAMRLLTYNKRKKKSA